MDKIELYKTYIEKCTTSAGSASNYSQFTRINKLLKARVADFTDLWSYDDAEKVSQFLTLLNEEGKLADEDNTTFKKLGNGQYFHALKYYIYFLQACQLFKKESRETVLNNPVFDITGKRVWLWKDDSGGEKCKSFDNSRIVCGESAKGALGNWSEYATKEAMDAKFREIKGTDSYSNTIDIYWNFLQAKKGDYVVVYKKKDGCHRMYGYGVVISDVLAEEDNIKHYLLIDWKVKFNEAITNEQKKTYLYFDSTDDQQAKHIAELINKYLNSNTNDRKNLKPLQQIFYGAPGTGKSFTIDKDTNENNRIRTTFHPDYDYAAFVGCYKPTTQKHAIEHKYGIYDVAALQAKFAAFSPGNSSKRITRFSCLYYNSLERMTSSEWQQIFLGFAKPTIEQDVNNGIAAAKEINNAHVLQDSQITYSFVPQSFTKAYVEAWRRFADANRQDKNYYLVIEEINRGNCAQTFGDLFQLLDRTRGGYSSYAVETDTDLQQFLATDETWRLNITLAEDIKNDEGRVIAKAEDVMSGKVLVLPPNLHIWATMNTSDQSLFPIDSAFKRRWDWTYVPIKYENTNWKVVLTDKSCCSWTELQTMLNDLIYEATESEDKMLGDWFVKADEKNEITEEQLVGKIIFYLWNDVAKVDAGTLFDLEVEKKRGRHKAVTFSDFYNMDGKTDTDIVKKWLTKIGITINEPESVDPEDEEDLDAELSETEIDNEDDSEIKAKRRELWTKFNEIMQSKGRAEANRVAPIKSYYNIRLGTTGLRIKNTVHVSPMTDFPPSVYTEVHFKEESYHIYEELNSRKNDLEKLFNEQIRWKENPKSHVISVERKTDFDNEDDTKAAIEWLANASIKMYDFIKPLVK